MRSQEKTPRVDYHLVVLVGALLLFGLVMLTSASGPTGFQRFGDTYHFLKRQVLLGIIPGLVLCFILSRLTVKHLSRLASFAFPGAVILLALGFIPGLAASYGAGSWIALGGISFQPSELAKLLLVIYFAWWLARRAEGAIRTFWSGFLPFIITVGIVIALMMAQSDLGTTSVIVAFLFAMYFSAGAPFSHISALLAGAFALFLILIKIAPYRAERLKIFLRPELDPQGVGYHVNQALMAIGSGGWFGLGLGKSRQKFLYLPEVAADSIYAVIAEELGFILSMLLVFAFVYFFWRGMRIADRAPDAFSRFVAIGLTVWITFQAFVNISAMVGLLPLTGVPLPFISHGGSAMLATLGATGLLFAISKEGTDAPRRPLARS